MTELKLLALDSQDLDVISAFTQDAIMKVEDVGFAKTDNRFAMLVNRFGWEDDDAGSGQLRRSNGARKRAAVRFDHVRDIRSTGINLNARDGVLELLAISFRTEDAPAGCVTLAFAGGGTIELDVDCLEVRLSDLGAAWSAKARPHHEL